MTREAYEIGTDTNKSSLQALVCSMGYVESLEQQNSIFKNALIEREKQEKLNLASWEELTFNLEQRIAELEKESHYKDMHISTLEAPKTCEGCVDEAHTNHLTCMYCNRQGTDCYRPKEISSKA